MRRIAFTLGTIGVAALLSGCVQHYHGHPRRAPAVVVHKPGPPPHAPAHGYRHKHAHHGVDLVFDSGLGVYIVVNLTDHYYHDGHFFRLHDGVWQISAHLNHGWKHASKRLPPGLAKKHGKKGHKRGPHPAKHR